MKVFWKKLLSFWPVFILLVFEILLFKANYIPGTWLIGWDSTQPELNLKLHLFRDLNAVWQEYRGLGLLDGMAHAANLVHLGYISLLSLFLPANLVRYVFVFLMHAVGGLGAYFLTRKLLNDASEFKKQILGFIASSFYLLNPGTIQMFYAPLELFVIHFGFLPWLILTAVNFLESGSKRSLFILFLVNLLAVSQAYVPTAFIVYAASLGIILTFFLIKSRFRKLKEVFMVVFIVFSTNAFWGLPYIYSAIKNAPVIANSKINLLSNPEIILRNRAFGDFKSVALLRGFSIDYQDWGEGESYGYQMGIWREHFGSPWVEKVGFVFFSLALLGILGGIIKKDWKILSFALILVLSFINLGSEIPYISPFRQFLIKNIPYYQDIFRFSFTKFVIVYALSISVLSAYATYLLTNFRRGWVVAFVFVLLLGLGMLFVGKPAFEGKFFYDSLRTALPNEYFEFFRFFDKNPGGRIALVPQPILWGWEYLKWGYRGSGFIWQGIGNPVLHRSFDPWSAENESYYQEFSRAYYLKDGEALEKIFEKYQIGWIVLDENIFLPGGRDESEFILWFKNYAETSLHYRQGGSFGSITIYKTDFDKSTKFIFAPRVYSKINADLTYSQIDTMYSKYNNYIQDKEGAGYPFVNFDKRGDVSISLSSSLSDIIFENKKQNAKVVLPIKDKISEEFGVNGGFANGKNCDILGTGRIFKQNFGDRIIYSAEAGGVSCDFFSYPNLSHSQGYVLRLKGQNIKGRSLKIYLQDWTTSRMDLEELLPNGSFDEYFTILPKNSEGKGYSLNLETRSFGTISSENIIEKIEFYPFDYNFLISIYTGNPIPKVVENNLTIKNVKKYGTWLHKVDVEGSGLIHLGRGYDEGWIAFEFKSQMSKVKALKHVKVNSWGNGWVVPTIGQFNNATIYIIFWPQVLEYIGFVVLAGTLVLVLTKR